jgi:cytochrome c peroxidase
MKCSLIGAALTASIALSFASPSRAAETIDQMKAHYVRPTSIPFPADDPYSDAKYELGRKLFFDPRLSGSGVTSCATCHNPAFNWSDGLAKGVGQAHKPLGRKTPTILNLAWDSLYFWDGRAGSMEQQALMPISSPAEMNMPHDVMIKRLDGVTAYRPLFLKAFPGEAEPISTENIARAIATFERKVISGTAPFDRWITGDEKAISASAKRGFVLFNGKANCAACHSGWNFSDGSFHDIGLPDADIGRGKILPALATMQHAFKTVGLRNIAQRYPYMHDGSLPTLAAVIDHYDGKFVRRDSLDDFMKPLNLDKQERADLIAFLQTLTSEDKPVAIPVLPR